VPSAQRDSPAGATALGAEARGSGITCAICDAVVAWDRQGHEATDRGSTIRPSFTGAPFSFGCCRIREVWNNLPMPEAPDDTHGELARLEVELRKAQTKRHVTTISKRAADNNVSGWQDVRRSVEPMRCRRGAGSIRLTWAYRSFVFTSKLAAAATRRSESARFHGIDLLALTRVPSGTTAPAVTVTLAPNLTPVPIRAFDPILEPAPMIVKSPITTSDPITTFFSMLTFDPMLTFSPSCVL